MILWVNICLIFLLIAGKYTLIFIDSVEKENQLPSLLTLKVDPPDQLSSESPTEVVLPQALEDVLALKNQRALELGTEEVADDNASKDDNDSEDGDDATVENKEDILNMSKSSKNKRKKKKKKNRNKQKREDMKNDDLNKKTNNETGEKDVEVE